MIKKFIPLNVSSKYAICGLPLRVDTYKTCSFNCKYCFSNYRKVMEFEKKLQVANLKWLKNKLNKVYIEKKVNPTSFLDNLLKDKITWHCGGMSDPFQPIENKLQITKKMVDITNKHNISILFSTKSDSVYNCDINKDLHSFQLSITNLYNNKKIEPNVPDINKRINFFHKLKDDGFKVGIRIQPFIPNITKTNIIDTFAEADYFTIEGLKLVPQNKSQKEFLINYLGLKRNDFTQMGLLNLKPEIRLRLYKDFINKLEKQKIPFSIADNDLHYITKSKCCCGEPLIKKSTNFNNTALFYKNKDYDIKDIEECLGEYKDCLAYQLVTSNRQEGCKTVLDFYKNRFNRASSPFSKKFMYAFREKEQTSISQFK